MLSAAMVGAYLHCPMIRGAAVILMTKGVRTESTDTGEPGYVGGR